MPEKISEDSPQITHARYLQPGMVYHIISKTLRGQFLLAPKKGVSSLCGGVVAMARQNWPEVKLYGFAFMSNHIHLMVSSYGHDVSGFVGFIKREISRCLGQRYKLLGTTLPQCGDGYLNEAAGEQCDSGGGCSENCEVEEILLAYNSVIQIDDYVTDTGTYDNTAGVSCSVSSLSIAVTINHTYGADVELKLSHVESGTMISLLDDSINILGTTDLVGTYTWNEDPAAMYWSQVTTSPAPTGSFYHPDSGTLAEFNGVAANANWRITAYDDYGGIEGTVDKWVLTIYCQ
jgi:REP element-mobilizing transposase RayT